MKQADLVRLQRSQTNEVILHVLVSQIEPAARTLRGMHYQLSPHAEANYIIAWRCRPGISDVRESPAFPLMSELLKRGAMLKAFDQ